MKNVHKISNFFSIEELSILDYYLNNENEWPWKPEKNNDTSLGRLIYQIYLPESFEESIIKRSQTITGNNLTGVTVTVAKYNSKYGDPNLFPHFDGDNNNVIIDYQYKSNTSWGLGLDTRVFEMNDNDAIIFNPNEYPHWRPHKAFKDDEFVTMIFFRFPTEGLDYSHLRYSREHEVFKEANMFRDSLS